MIYGIGVDIIEVARIAERMETEKGLKETLFTEREIAYCETKRFRGQHYAARFAAKEAFLKALGSGWRDGIAFREIEVVNDALGRPTCLVHGRAEQAARQQGIRNIQMSLSHIKEFAGAVVTLET